MMRLSCFGPRRGFCPTGRNAEKSDLDLRVAWSVSLCYAVALALLCAMALFWQPGVAFADAGVSYRVEAEPSLPAAGEDVLLTFSLEGYGESASDGIQALQIDVEGLDPALVSGVSCSSLIEDEDGDVFTNNGTFSEVNERARLAYVKYPGTLVAPCNEVFELRFTLLGSLAESGTLVLPITFLAETESGAQTEISQTYLLDYVGSSSLNTVQITWGSFDFAYTEGLWNPATHTVGEGAWSVSASGDNTIFVRSLMAEAGSVKFAFTPAEGFSGIGCAFYRDEAGITPLEELFLARGEESTVWLLPNGALPKGADGAVVGAVTVTLGGE